MQKAGFLTTRLIYNVFSRHGPGMRILDCSLEKRFVMLRILISTAVNTKKCQHSLSSVIFYTTDRSKAVILICFSLFACFGVSFCTVFHLMCV